MGEKRTCKKCKSDKELVEFVSYIRKEKTRFTFTCLACKKIRSQQYYIANKLHIDKKQKEYGASHKQERKEYSEAYYIENRESILEQQKAYNKADPERKKIYDRKFKIETGYDKFYREKNKVILSEKRRANERKRMATDVSFRLKKRVSRDVWGMLKKSNSSKGNISFLKFLGYTIDELKKNLENQFEPWMSWENWGPYNPKTWDDDDSGTWTWSLDHRVPQSDLPYKSMEDENFKQCWALSNLRPLSAKQNNLDGSTRVRHSKKEK